MKNINRYQLFDIHSAHSVVGYMTYLHGYAQHSQCSQRLLRFKVSLPPCTQIHNIHSMGGYMTYLY